MFVQRTGALRVSPALLVLLFSLSACGGGSATGWQGSITDSAGVRVVSNPSRGLWNGNSPWSFTEELRIGTSALQAGGSEEAMFGSVTGIDVDSAGDVYVADQQARQVQVFGPDGHFLRTIGAPGNGPGEMQSVSGVLLHGGEVWVPDLNNQRIDRFDPDGKSLGSDPLDFTRGIPSKWAHLDGGRLLARFQALPMPGMVDKGTGDPLVAFGAQGRDTLLVLPKGKTLTISDGQARMRLFEPEPRWDASPEGRIFVANTGAYRVEEYDGTGKLLQVVTKPYTPVKVTDSDQQKILEAVRRRMSQQGLPAQALDQVLSAVRFADTYPAMQTLLAGPDGTLWVQRVRTAAELTEASGEIDLSRMGSRDWDVFGADGRYLGVLSLPPRFSPMLVRGDEIWGAQRDSLDVPSVVRYRLERGS